MDRSESSKHGMTPESSISAGFSTLAASASAMERGDLDEVVVLTTELIESGYLSEQGIAVAHYQRGLAFCRKKLYECAIEDFNEAIRFDPEFARAYYHRGYVCRKTGRTGHAIENYNRAIRLDPEFVPAYINRGAIHIDEGLYYHAIQDFHQAIRLAPDHPRVYSDRGCAFYGNGRYDRALEDFNEALKLDPAFALAHLHRGHVFCATGCFDQAIDAYTQALGLDPKFALAYKNRAHVYFYQSRFSEAGTDYSKYVELRAEDIPALIMWRLAHARAGENEDAALARQAQGIDITTWPGAAVAMFLGILTPQEMLVQARADSEIIKNDGRHLGYFYAGEYYLLQGRTADAVEMFRQAILDGANDCFEHTFAEAELGRLGVSVLIPRERR